MCEHFLESSLVPSAELVRIASYHFGFTGNTEGDVAWTVVVSLIHCQNGWWCCIFRYYRFGKFKKLWGAINAVCGSRHGDVVMRHLNKIWISSSDILRLQVSQKLTNKRDTCSY